MRSPPHLTRVASLGPALQRPAGVVCALLLACAAHTPPTGIPTASNGVAASPSHAQAREYLDIPYADSALPIQHLDIYTAPGSTPRPLVLFVHGGSWIGGDKSKVAKPPALLRWWRDQGYTVAVPNFRLATRPPSHDVGWAEQLDDLTQAMVWLRDNADQYNTVDSGILLVGYSSGAHLVAMLATREGPLRAAGLPDQHIRGVISMDVHAYDVPFALQLMRDSEIAANARSIRWIFGDDVPTQQVGSPVSYLNGAPPPPALLISADPATPGSKGIIARDASAHYARTLTDAGYPATHAHFDTETHSSIVTRFGTPGHGPTQAVDTFLRSL